MRVCIHILLPFLMTVMLQAETALKQSQVKGLLVFQLQTGEFASQATQMNATIVPKSEADFTVGFNQEVGELMSSANEEVLKFISIRHAESLPQNTKIEFGL